MAEERRQRALDREFARVQKEADKSASQITLQALIHSQPSAEVSVTPDPLLPQDLSPDSGEEGSLLEQEVDEITPEFPRGSPCQALAATPSTGIQSGSQSDMAAIISEAIRQGIVAELMQRDSPRASGRSKSLDGKKKKSSSKMAQSEPWCSLRPPSQSSTSG